MTSSERHPDSLSRAIKWSLIAHGILLIALFIQGEVFPGNPIMVTPSLRVDVVGLPDILKKDLMKIPKAPPVEATPIPVPPVKAEPVKNDELVLHPKKAAKKTSDKKLQGEMNDALARLRALEKIKEQTEVENRPVVIKGNQVSHGSSLAGDARENAQMTYAKTVRDRIAENWSLPPWLTRQNYSAQVRIQIGGGGKITAIQMIKPSGSAPFDQAVQETLQASQPLPIPPADIAQAMSTSGILVGFPL